jgi:hypothetical protein
MSSHNKIVKFSIIVLQNMELDKKIIKIKMWLNIIKY